MLGASKILTVSYGTFSCTLEGFDDPFSTMKSIAEYFRDLAADDRYFGAEPPTPDPEMLHRIAEREVKRRVEAHVDEGGIVLRQSDTEADDTAPTPLAAPLAAAAATELAPAGESIAAKLARIRSSVARAENEQVEGFSEDEHADVFAPAPDDAFEGPDEPLDAYAAPEFELSDDDVMPSADEASAAVFAETEVSETPHASLNEDEPDYDAPEAATHEEQTADRTELAEIANAPDMAPAADEAYFEAPQVDASSAPDVEEMQSAEPFFDTEGDEDNLLAEGAEDEEPIELSIFDGIDEAPEAEDHTEAADDEVSAAAASLLGDIAAARAEEAADADETPDDTEVASIGDAVVAAEEAIATAEEELDEAEDALIEARMDVEDAERSVAEAEIEAEEAQDALDEADLRVADLQAALADDSDENDVDAALILEEEVDATDDDEPLVLGDEIRQFIDDDEAQSEASESQHLDEAEMEPAAEAALADALSLDDEPPAEDDSPRARLVKMKRADYESAQADENDLSPEAEAELQAELAEVEAEMAEALGGKVADTDDADDEEVAEASEEAEDTEADADPRENLEDDGPDVERILEKTNDQFEQTDNRSRRSAIAHLKAAVAATKADAAAGDQADDSDEPTELDRYREDLARAVRPRRPVLRAKGDRPAPLVLVTEQRVDTPVQPVRRSEDAGPVIPRRVTKPTPKGLPDIPVRADEDNENIFREGPSFREFAEEMDATDLPDLLEAAAAYTSFIEGRPSFSRPQVMRQLSMFDQDVPLSREAGLRAFGQLLREGKLQRLSRGEYAIAKSSRFNPEAREAG